MSPEARGISYEEIWLKTKDNIRLQGWFMFQDLDFFRIEFEQGDGKDATGLVGHYNNGHQDRNTRTD